jgi:hypothetical protein
MIKCIEVCKRNIGNAMKHILNGPLKGRISENELNQIDSEYHNDDDYYNNNMGASLNMFG